MPREDASECERASVPAVAGDTTAGDIMFFPAHPSAPPSFLPFLLSSSHERGRSGNAWKEFHYIRHKPSLGLEDEVTGICWSEVSVASRNAVLLAASHDLIKTKFNSSLTG